MLKEEGYLALANRTEQASDLLRGAGDELCRRADAARARGRSHHIDYLRLAGNCYRDAGHHLSAAQTYYKAKMPSDTATQFLKGGDIPRAFEICTSHTDINQAVRIQVEDAARRHFIIRKVSGLDIW
jgi:hypothetical protein